MIPQPLNRPMFTIPMGQPVGQQPQPQQQGIMSVAPITAPPPNAPVQLASLQNQQVAPVTTVGQPLVQLADAGQRVPPPVARPRLAPLSGPSDPDAVETEGADETKDDGEAEDATNLSTEPTPTTSDIESLVDATRKAAPAKVQETNSEATNPASPATSQNVINAEEEAKNAARSITKPINNESDFQSLLKALGPGNITDYTKYNEQAKKLLGIPEEKSDVPDWAAPMFLFGLKLMQGPVTSKQQGADSRGVSGLLSDVGAAAETGFAYFAQERARGEKRRARIASLSMQLGQADASRKKLILDAYKLRAQNKLNLEKFAATRHDKLIDQLIRMYPGESPESTKARAVGVNGINDAIAGLVKRGVDINKAMKSPGVRSLIFGHAVNEASRMPTKSDIKTIKFFGNDHSYSPKALRAAMVKYNKANPNKKIDDEIIMLGKILGKDPDVSDYMNLVVGGGDPSKDIEFSSRTRVDKNGDTWTDSILRNRAGLRAYIEEFEQKHGKPPSSDQIANNSWRFEKVMKSTLAGNAKLSQGSYTAESGEVINYTYNSAALKSSGKTLSEVLDQARKNPDSVKNIIQVNEDLKNFVPEYSVITVGVGGGNTQRFMYDKNALRKAYRDKKINLPSETDGVVTTVDPIIDQMINLGIGRYVGKPIVPQKKPTTANFVGADGSVMSVTGPDAVADMQKFYSKKAIEQFKQQGVGLNQLHRLSYNIRALLRPEDPVEGQRVASRLTPLARFLESGQRLFKGYWRDSTSGGTTSQMRSLSSGRVGQIRIGNQTIASNLSSRGRELVNDALNGMANNSGLMFGGVAIDTDVKRSQVSSMFVNLAFALASAREGGKLTDNDVKNALKTLGWDEGSFTQTPEQILGTLEVAVRDASDRYRDTAVLNMSDAELTKHQKAIAEGKGDVVESLLRRFASASDPRDAKGIVKAYIDGRDSGEEYRISYHLNRRLQPRSAGAVPSPGSGQTQQPQNQTYKYGNQTITYTGNALTQEENDLLRIMSRRNVPRTVAGVEAWYNSLPQSRQQAISDSGVIQSLRDKNFFGTD
tara:strand:+ start:2768 stop:5911 length:3144 start_codon:yes stop_codon:yes gene_type:complete